MQQPLPLQTTYQQYQTVAQVGIPATMVGWDADAKILDDPTGLGVGFGKAVSQSYRSSHSVCLGQLSGGEFIGITMASAAQYLSPTRTVDVYYNNDEFPVMVRGDIWVLPTTHVNAGDPVYYNSATGDLGNSSVPNAVLIQNSRWRISLPRPANDPVNYNGLSIARLGAAAQ